MIKYFYIEFTYQFVRDLIASEKIAEVRTVKSSFAFPMKPARMWLDNDPIAITAMAKLNEHGADTSLSGILDFDGGRYAHFEMSFEHARRSEYEIIGTLGGVKCDTVWQNPDDAPVINWWTDAGE